jgi:hypothetical protein
MLYKANRLTGFEATGLDGPIGKVGTFYFDDRFWTVRYLAVDAGDWLAGRQVLLSPRALLCVDPTTCCIRMDLVRQQVEDSPHVDPDAPITREYEEDYHGYYGWEKYWSGPYMWGVGDYPSVAASPYRESEFTERKTELEEKTPWGASLHGTKDVTGYPLQALDGEIGHVVDFLLDEETWAIRYLVIDMRHLGPSRRILVAPPWIDRVGWSESKVYVDLPREILRNAPAYDEDCRLDRSYEAALHDYYRRSGYWVDERPGGGRPEPREPLA